MRLQLGRGLWGPRGRCARLLVVVLLQAPGQLLIRLTCTYTITGLAALPQHNDTEVHCDTRNLGYTPILPADATIDKGGSATLVEGVVG